MNTSITTRVGTVVLLATAAAVTPAAAHGSPVHEPSASSPSALTYSSPYAEPLAALGGKTLAQYVSEHMAAVLGSPGV